MSVQGELWIREEENGPSESHDCYANFVCLAVSGTVSDDGRRV